MCRVKLFLRRYLFPTQSHCHFDSFDGYCNHTNMPTLLLKRRIELTIKNLWPRQFSVSLARVSKFLFWIFDASFTGIRRAGCLWATRRQYLCRWWYLRSCWNVKMMQRSSHVSSRRRPWSVSGSFDSIAQEYYPRTNLHEILRLSPVAYIH